MAGTTYYTAEQRADLAKQAKRLGYADLDALFAAVEAGDVVIAGGIAMVKSKVYAEYRESLADAARNGA